MKKILLILGLLFLISCQNSSNKYDIDPSINPFFQEWNTPYEIPPFLFIKNEHYMPAFEKGMEENLKEIEEIIKNPQEPTFENTIEELERTGKLLYRVQAFNFLINSSNSSG